MKKRFGIGALVLITLVISLALISNVTASEETKYCNSIPAGVKVDVSPGNIVPMDQYTANQNVFGSQPNSILTAFNHYSYLWNTGRSVTFYSRTETSPTDFNGSYGGELYPALKP